MSDTKPGQRPRRRTARRGPTTPDPVEIAMEAEQADGSEDSPARRLLVEQEKLIRSQRRSEDAGAGLKVLTGLVGVAAAAAVAGMVWDASRERGLVIEAFTTPPALAAKGLTGEVLAGQLEDQLSRLEAATDSARAQATYTNDWGHDIKVEIPRTGVSISELQRFLRQWLGHQTRVTGDLYQTASGYKLTVRSGPDATIVTGASEAELDRMLADGAQALFARTQPYRYAVYLAQNNRIEDSRKVLHELADNGPPEERGWAIMGLGITGLPPDVSLKYVREAVVEDPSLALAWHNLGITEQSLGHTDAGTVAFKRSLALMRRRDHGGMSLRSAAVSLQTASGAVAYAEADLPRAIEANRALARMPAYYGSRDGARLNLGLLLAENHEVVAARATIPDGLDDGALSKTLLKWETYVQPNYAVAVELEDWPRALAEARAVEAVMSKFSIQPGVQPDTFSRLNVRPQIIEALANMGRFADAEALAATLPADCDLCLRARGKLAALARQPAEADRWFADAVRQNPLGPRAYAEWGRAKLIRGDAAGAAVLFKQAISRQPKWADGYAGLGETLARRGDGKGAVANYRKATQLAPNWGGAHLRLGDALAAARKADQARAEWRIAARLPLSAADASQIARRKI